MRMRATAPPTARAARRADALALRPDPLADNPLAYTNAKLNPAYNRRPNGQVFERPLVCDPRGGPGGSKLTCTGPSFEVLPSTCVVARPRDVCFSGPWCVGRTGRGGFAGRAGRCVQGRALGRPAVQRAASHAAESALLVLRHPYGSCATTLQVVFTGLPAHRAWGAEFRAQPRRAHERRRHGDSPLPRRGRLGGRL